MVAADSPRIELAFHQREWRTAIRAPGECRTLCHGFLLRFAECLGAGEEGSMPACRRGCRAGGHIIGDVSSGGARLHSFAKTEVE
jgi:hypothetical protein